MAAISKYSPKKILEVILRVSYYCIGQTCLYSVKVKLIFF